MNPAIKASPAIDDPLKGQLGLGRGSFVTPPAWRRPSRTVLIVLCADRNLALAQFCCAIRRTTADLFPSSATSTGADPRRYRQNLTRSFFRRLTKLRPD